MLDFICEEDILKLEEKISENVISKYETIREFLKSQRNQYFQEKSVAAAYKIENFNSKSIYGKIKEEKSFKQKQNDLKISIEKIKKRLERKFGSINYYVRLRNNHYVIHFIN